MAVWYDGRTEPRYRALLLLVLLELLVSVDELELDAEQLLEEREAVLDEANGRGRGGGGLALAGVTMDGRAGTVRLRRRSSLACWGTLTGARRDGVG